MNGERDSLRPDASGGIFDGKVENGNMVAPPATPYREPDADAVVERNRADERKALRRLQDKPPNTFEQLIDMLYAWKEYANPHSTNPFTDVVRRLIGQNHDVGDAAAVIMLKGFIREARSDKINRAIAKLGLDEAERLLGLKDEE